MTDLIKDLGHLAGGTRFRRISEKLYVDGDKIYREAGIDFKASWFPVFYVLAGTESPITIMNIAAHIDFSHITVKHVLKELDAAGLVDIRQNPADKRSKTVQLSPSGKAKLAELEPLWLRFSKAMKSLYDAGHPDLLNMLNRFDRASHRMPLNERVKHGVINDVRILDYRPSLKQYFYDLAAPWLLGVLNGELEAEDKYTLANPDKAYIEKGGFLFFAKYHDDIAGCVVLKRLDEHTFEFAKLFVSPDHRKLGIATRLIERCITRCMENDATELWLQTRADMHTAHQLYYKLGFEDAPAPPQLDVLNRTEKIMCKRL